MHSAVKSPGVDTSFEHDVRSFVDEYAELWRGSSITPPDLGLIYTVAAQQRNQREADFLIDYLERELRNYPANEREQSTWRERVLRSLRRIGTEFFHFPNRHFDIILSPEYLAVTRTFACQARAFDGSIEIAPLAQALRNVWVMNCLQMILGRQPSLTPSIFAYSMLYPYTDNYIDQPNLSRESKETACRRLGFRLSGRTLEPGDAHEAAVFRLIEMIEGDYQRETHPAVYSSLLAIHAGQVKSLSQQRSSGALDEPALLQISIEKGGSSVLADGWLVAGKLTREEARFFFGFGVMLQLSDDLQDLPDDCSAGHMSLFTHAASTEVLDDLTSRLWHFMNGVLNATDCFADPRIPDLKDLIRRNCTMLMLRAVAENEVYYSEDYLRHMERFSPLSFPFLRDRRAALEKKFTKIWPPLARRRKLRSIFDLLGT